NQLFSKLGWQDDATRLELSYIHTDNNLTGNGFAPENLLHGDRDQIHTRPDFTNNYYHHLALNGTHWFNDETMFSGNLYYRKSNRHTLNGDLYEAEIDGDDLGSVNKNNPYGWGSGAEDELEATGSALNTSKTSQDNYGLT